MPPLHPPYLVPFQPPATGRCLVSGGGGGWEQLSSSIMKRKRNNFAVKFNIVEINDKNATLQTRLKINTYTYVETLIKMYFHIYIIILWVLKYSMTYTK